MRQSYGFRAGATSGLPICERMDRARLDRFVSQRLDEFPLVRPITLSSSDSAQSAVAAMRQAGQSCVLTEEEGKLTGIFTERDVLSRCMQEGFDWEQSLGALTSKPQVIAGSRTVADAIALMHQRRYRTLPVMDGDAVLGIIRTADIVTNFVEAYPEDLLNLPPRPHQVMETREGG
ncbi:MAG: CBS domain-containing protein [Tepidiformaceae bacterium]